MLAGLVTARIAVMNQPIAPADMRDKDHDVMITGSGHPWSRMGARELPDPVSGEIQGRDNPSEQV
jgi:hypothetical protein